MLVTEVRASLKSRLASLFRRRIKNEVPNVADDRWLTQQEVAKMLQPHMPNRNVFAWLELDRNVDPSLPFLQQHGHVAYRLADVRAFIHRMPKSTSVSHTEHEFVSENVDRRKLQDRRSGPQLGGVNDRRKSIDRRAGFDRRNGPDRRQMADLIGYGRKGDRRGRGASLDNPQ